jgi:hypothetical protein
LITPGIEVRYGEMIEDEKRMIADKFIWCDE